MAVKGNFDWASFQTSLIRWRGTDSSVLASCTTARARLDSNAIGFSQLPSMS